MLVEYARVSTEGQNLDMQVRQLEAAGCTKIFQEKITGTRSDRPEYQAMKEFVRDSEDTVVVYKLDRLGRSLKHPIHEMQIFKDRNVEFRSLQEHIDMNTSGGKLFFHIFAAIAEFERDIIKERTITGLEQQEQEEDWEDVHLSYHNHKYRYSRNYIMIRIMIFRIYVVLSILVRLLYID